MRFLDLVLLALGCGQSASGDESPKEILRTEVRSAFGAGISFTDGIYGSMRWKCDFVGTLLELLEQAPESEDRQKESLGALHVLAKYWREFPDGRIPAALRRCALASDRPESLRYEAVERRGRMPGGDTPAFYVEILGQFPALGGPLVAWLRALAIGVPGWSIRDVYTPDVRTALDQFVAARLALPNLMPEDRKFYSSLIMDLDKAAGLPLTTARPAQSTQHRIPKTTVSVPVSSNPLSTSAPSSSSRAVEVGPKRAVLATIVLATLGAGIIAFTMKRALRR